MSRCLGGRTSSEWRSALASTRTVRRRALFAGIATALAMAGLPPGGARTAGAAVDVSDVGGVTILPVDHTGGAAQDWRAHGSVTPVKNEGACDSSWAFGITGLVESFTQIRMGILHSLSEQQLIDCDSFGTACAGGRPVGSMRLLIAEGGLESEASYPYTARPGTCNFNPASVVATFPGVGRVPPADELSLQAYVGNHGPVLALIDASQPSFDLYRSGIYYEPNCNTFQPTRAVLVVGYGSSGGNDYWIVKNSQGTSWGDNGYILMSRNRGNNCGIASYAFSVADLAIADVGPAVPLLGPGALTALGVLIAVAALMVLLRVGR